MNNMKQKCDWKSSTEKPINEYNQGGAIKSVLVEAITAQKTRVFTSFYSYPVENVWRECWITDEGAEICSKNHLLAIH